MTVTALIVRFWLSGQRANIIAAIPHLRSNYTVDENGRLKALPPIPTTIEKPCYVWMDGVREQLIASVCERASKTGAEVELTAEQTQWGWLLKHAILKKVEPVPEQASA